MKKGYLKPVPEGGERPEGQEPNLEKIAQTTPESAEISPEWLARYHDSLRERIVAEVTEKVSGEYEAQITGLRKKHDALRDDYIKLLDEIDNLRAKAYEDPLTGVGNRRSHDENLEMRASELERGQSDHLGYMLMDIDHFKNVNDEYGHGAGDDILKAAAGALKYNRGSDKAFRYGGEEFAILCPNTDASGLEEIGRRVSDAVNEATRVLAEQSESEKYPSDGVTISIGYGVMKKGESIPHFLERVDDALYVSKENGRDRMTLSLGEGEFKPIYSEPHK